MPKRSMDLQGWRAAGAPTATQWDALDGVALSMWTLPAATLTGQYAGPQSLPMDCDPSYPIDLYATLRNPLLLTTTSRVIVFETKISYANVADPIASHVVPLMWASPDNWPAGDWVNVLLRDDTDPDSPTIPAGTLRPGARFAVRHIRDGAHANDNFPHQIQVLAALTMVYHLRCQSCCC